MTGGASGLGLETAKRIVAEGGRVALWDLDEQRLGGVQKEIGAHYTRIVDVSDASAVAQAAENYCWDQKFYRKS